MPRPRVCVSCNGQERRSKLLKCLHSICVGCLPANVTRQSEVRCPSCGQLTPPPPAGKPQHLWLPDCVAVDAGGSEQEHLKCEECMDTVSAVRLCSDCGAWLCEDHGKAHPRNRATYRHRVESMSQSATASATSQPNTLPHSSIAGKACILHPDHQLKKFCLNCKDLLCEVCLRSGHNASHSLLSVDQAAEELRSRVQSLLCDDGREEGASEGGDGVSKVITRINSVIDAVRNRTLDVSEQVEAYFARAHELLKRRQDEILASLDALGAAKLIPLEEQKQRLKESQRQLETVSSLLTSCVNPYDFVAMGNWLEDAARNASVVAKQDHAPCVSSNLVFLENHHEQLAAATANTGLVYDAGDLDASRSLLECPSYVKVNNELEISVQPVHSSGHAMKAAQVPVTSLDVKITSSQEGAQAWFSELAANADDTHLVAKFHAEAAGQYEVSAMYCGRHIRGSPSKFHVSAAQLTFDPNRCHSDIQLSSDNRTAIKSSGTYCRAVYSLQKFSTGRTDLQVQVDRIRRGLIFIGFSIAKEGFRGSTFGWWGDSATDSTNQGRLGQKWRSGDIISLSLDCHRHTLTGTHHRTGQTHTINGVSGELHLYVFFGVDDDQVTILYTE